MAIERPLARRGPWAAIDIGTNSVLLAIVGEGLVPIVELAEITRLGEGVDAHRGLSDAACERTIACLERYATEIRRHRVAALDVVGTSAMRDAAGGSAFVDRAESVLGVRPRVISGDEEASLTFSGALVGVGIEGAVTVFDIGGGSTEVIHGSGNDVRYTRSLDVGSVRLFERHARSDPPTLESLTRARAETRALLDTIEAPSHDATLVGVAGTVTTLAAIRSELAVYDSAVVHGSLLSSAELDAISARLAALPLRARRDVVGLEPARADVIVLGAAIAAEVLSWAGRSSLVVSDRGVRWGLLRRLSARDSEPTQPFSP